MHAAENEKKMGRLQPPPGISSTCGKAVKSHVISFPISFWPITSNPSRRAGCLGDKCVSTSVPKTGLVRQISSLFHVWKLYKKPNTKTSSQCLAKHKANEKTSKNIVCRQSFSRKKALVFSVISEPWKNHHFKWLERLPTSYLAPAKRHLREKRSRSPPSLLQSILKII